ncbi:MAG: 4-(cytidine 5'-diphospho)-2-C-methyl-D-erythritol kinase [Clostridiales bacterium]|nr:4-(cytidine 5'-diphospho)-2-C-methyl-D-erythritol kinase [Clostridiales bacterium]
MTAPLTEPAWAKLNLTLDVLGRRADGFHDLRMVMQSVSLHDDVVLTLTEEPGIRLATNFSFLPTDGRNLAVMAANAFQQATGVDVGGLRIRVEKHIPVCAGTAGGSSDAAAVLRGLNRLYETGLTPEQLAKIGEDVGSDVPYCVLGGTALAEGRGERLTRLPALPDCAIVMCKPSFAVSTPELFHRIDSFKLRCHPDTAGMLKALEEGSLQGVARRLYNVFEDVLPPQQGNAIREIRQSLIESGALGACLSGTGPTVFGIFEAEEEARRAAAVLAPAYRETFVVRPVA